MNGPQAESGNYLYYPYYHTTGILPYPGSYSSTKETAYSHVTARAIKFVEAKTESGSILVSSSHGLHKSNESIPGYTSFLIVLSRPLPPVEHTQAWRPQTTSGLRLRTSMSVGKCRTVSLKKHIVSLLMCRRSRRWIRGKLTSMAVLRETSEDAHQARQGRPLGDAPSEPGRRRSRVQRQWCHSDRGGAGQLYFPIASWHIGGRSRRSRRKSRRNFAHANLGGTVRNAS